MRRALALIAFGALAANVSAQPSQEVSKAVGVEKLADDLFVLTGGGANAVVFITELGVVLVDTKDAGWGEPMLDAIKTLTSKPVTTIINTHAHPDHVGSNDSFPLSVEIVAQRTTRLNMDRLPGFKGVKVHFLPKLMFTELLTLGSGRDRIDVYHHGAGHTGGDAWVVFPARGVMHAGDMIVPKQPPIIDLENGGSGLAYPDTLARAITATKSVDVIVPGHGRVVRMKEMEEYAAFTRDFRDAVVSGYNQGLGVSEVAAEWRTPGRYEGYTADPARVRANVEAMFGELGR